VHYALFGVSIKEAWRSSKQIRAYRTRSRASVNL